MLRDIIDNTIKLLEESFQVSFTSTQKENAGLLLKFYQEDSSESSRSTKRDLSKLRSEDMQELTQEEIKSIYEYGFKVNNEYSSKYDETYDTIFLTLEDYSEELLINYLSEIESKINISKITKLILFFDIDESPNGLLYQTEIYNICRQFKQSIGKNENIDILGINLVTEYASEQYLKECYIRNSFHISLKYNILLITNKNYLEYQEYFKRGGSYYIQESVFEYSGAQEGEEDLNKRNNIQNTIFYLAYFSLTKHIKFLFENVSRRFDFLRTVTQLFSHQWAQSSDMLKFRISLNNQRVAVLNKNSEIIAYGLVLPIEDRLIVKAIPLDYILKGNDLEVILEIIEPEIIEVNSKMIYNIFDVFDIILDIYKTFSKDKFSRDYMYLQDILNKMQKVCIQRLRENLISVKEIIIFDNKGKLYFGTVPKFTNSMQIGLIDDDTSEIVVTKLPDTRILPTQIILDNFNTDMEDTDFKFPILTEQELKAVSESYNILDYNYYSDYWGKEMYKEALLCIRNVDTQIDKIFFDSCLKIDKSSIKDLIIGVSGDISKTIDMTYSS